MSALAVAAPVQAEVRPGVWTFLYADKESLTGTYVPENQDGAKGSVTKYADGRYRVELDGVGAPGVPMVTAVGGNGVHCQLASFGSNGLMYVDCYAGTARKNSKFMLTFFSPPADSPANSAYGFAFSGPQATSFPGGTSISTDASSGVSTVQFTRAGFTNGGNVQVTAVGRSPARCSVMSWVQTTSGVTAQVKCKNLFGQSPVPPQWTLVYARERSIIGGDTEHFGYLQADRPDWSSPDPYPPDPNRNRGPNGYTHVVRRPVPNVGTYQVRVHGALAEAFTLHVSVNGDTAGFCVPTGWNFNLADPEWPGTVDVACFDGAGAPANQVFTLNYYSPS
ncbi:hypothetical protein [Actinophytocola sp.]|uniref:hypothetical protein n=1 Tax=Actinophytocola sp. TaxID=1872138 RepID=UPI002ED27FD3